MNFIYLIIAYSISICIDYFFRYEDISKKDFIVYMSLVTVSIIFSFILVSDIKIDSLAKIIDYILRIKQ
ncbi:hypothetical protein [Desnuesiella massiliensis]|uniref:hypothetical protein n=1 Tax=Desnuesiella massiliensis TaxID=1650662 RepID=UPI0006E33DE0|nr:hypothetical protein [Desnuesiella massiliensis]